MRHRLWRFKEADRALIYMAFLTSQGYSFGVNCTTRGVDIETPFEMPAADWPSPKDIAI